MTLEELVIDSANSKRFLNLKEEVKKTVKVAINGYGTVGKRVADAVNMQNDMIVVGVVKATPDYSARIAAEKFYLYVPKKEDLEKFEKAGIPVAGTLEDLLEIVDIVVDGTPGDMGEEYKKLYQKHDVKAIWQGGEEHSLAGFSFNSEANYNDAIGRQFARVVSCNTTGLVRVLYALDAAFGIKKVRATLIRRAADPKDIKTGPINAIVFETKNPSHHGPDVNSILPGIDITTVAVKVPTTLMHGHAINVEFSGRIPAAEEVIKLFSKRPRIRLVSKKPDKIGSTAEAMELARDLGRPRGDMWENIVWKDSISVTKDGELYFFQAIHQESDIVPENIDAIRAMMELEMDGEKSIAKTNEAMGIGK